MIDIWLQNFKKAWLDKDVPEVMSLFTAEVEYWETPFQRLAYEHVSDEWQVIHHQDNINLTIHHIATEGTDYICRWDLTYDKQGANVHWRGMYIIRLNQSGKCEYFYQVGESQ